MSSMQRFLFSIIAVVVVLAAGLLYLGFGGKPSALSPETRMESQKPPVENISGKERGPEAANQNPIPVHSHLVTIETNYGVIKFETYDKDAPKTTDNFVALADKNFYDGLIFHRVIPGFMIQGGDPNGNGTGGPGYQFEDELNPETLSYKEGYKKGVVAMANAGPDTNGSQFFIMLEDYPLPNAYTIFGKVVGGLTTVNAIGRVATGANDRPLEPVVMKSVTVEHR